MADAPDETTAALARICQALSQRGEGLDGAACEFLRKTGAIDEPIIDDDTPLTHACDKSDLGTVLRLLAAGADPNALNTWGQSPLMWASRADAKLPIVRALLAAGAHVELANQVHDRPLHTACFGGCLAVAAELIARGADMEAPGQSGRAPLHIACAMGNPRLLRMLIELGADFEREFEVKGRSTTPLLFCQDNAAQGHGAQADCARLLAQASAVRGERLSLAESTPPPSSEPRHGHGSTPAKPMGRPRV